MLRIIVQATGPRPRPEMRRLQQAARTLLLAQAQGLEMDLEVEDLALAKLEVEPVTRVSASVKPAPKSKVVIRTCLPKLTLAPL